MSVKKLRSLRTTNSDDIMRLNRIERRLICMRGYPAIAGTDMCGDARVTATTILLPMYCVQKSKMYFRHSAGNLAAGAPKPT